MVPGHVEARKTISRETEGKWTVKNQGLMTEALSVLSREETERERGGLGKGKKGSICHMLLGCVNEPTGLREPGRWTPLRGIEFADRDCSRQRGHMWSGECVRPPPWGIGGRGGGGMNRAARYVLALQKVLCLHSRDGGSVTNPSVPSLLYWLITRAVWPSPGRGAITDPPLHQTRRHSQACLHLKQRRQSKYDTQQGEIKVALRQVSSLGGIQTQLKISKMLSSLGFSNISVMSLTHIYWFIQQHTI